MTLSIEKLEKLLSIKGFLPIKFYTMNNVCVYIEILNIETMEKFFLYIPSKYKFKLKKGRNIYKIKYLNIQDNNNIEDFIGELDKYELENEYGKIDLDLSYDEDKNISNQLENNYKKLIDIKNISNKNNKEITNIYRQLKRLRYCVETVPYKIIILFKNYLCTLQRDCSIDIFLIKEFKGNFDKVLYISTDLENLYKHMDSIKLNLSNIKREIYNILDKNHYKHTSVLNKISQEKKDIVALSEYAYSCKLEYDKHLTNLEFMLEACVNKEKKLIINIEEINESKTGYSELYKDIDKSHAKNNLDKDLKEILKIKKEIIKNIFELKNKKENTILTIDQIMFDNTVMVNEVLQNFKKLRQISIN